MTWATAFTATAYYIAYPLTLQANFLLVVLKTVAAPWIYVGLYMLHIFIISPVRFLLKFEPLYIFLSIASVLGISTGIFLHFISRYMQQVLGISSKSGGKDIQDLSYHAKTERAGDSYLIHPNLSINDGKDDLRSMREWDAAEVEAQSGNTDTSGLYSKTRMGSMRRIPAMKQEWVDIYPANVLGSVKWKGKAMYGNGGDELAMKPEGRRENLLSTMIFEEDDSEND
ncbi:uncharacterized protein PADG_06259 [Paracoccidioides brasiliensis Pb18]|uniref:Uncharacterized protein n=1 Tax=Paracoccidioides brasiliensis (strain Pb18) TaxID=502780 RepID=C1GG22_PARBD|nr:uncharacterized protein PADG_06259 [Paracoccidioides brasiliensis Pb18]EEH50180.1 hypothetical protein PADG_06259 [Paracoccidioides brasiliensis Pb18]